MSQQQPKTNEPLYAVEMARDGPRTFVTLRRARIGEKDYKSADFGVQIFVRESLAYARLCEYLRANRNYIEKKGEIRL